MPAFRVDFSDRDAASQLFEEGVGSLTTGGSLACMRPDHVQYAALLSTRSAAGAEIGARLLLDGNGAAACPGAHVAVGHLGSRAYYGFGDFEWRARIHHSPSGGAPPPNAFTCFSVYANGVEAHNELAWCFDGRDVRGVHISWWVDARMHRIILHHDDDLSRASHTFTTRWPPSRVE